MSRPAGPHLICTGRPDHWHAPRASGCPVDQVDSGPGPRRPWSLGAENERKREGEREGGREGPGGQGVHSWCWPDLSENVPCPHTHGPRICVSPTRIRIARNSIRPSSSPHHPRVSNIRTAAISTVSISTHISTSTSDSTSITASSGRIIEIC
eukprot:3577964-Rhodomonas_salina.1